MEINRREKEIVYGFWEGLEKGILGFCGRSNSGNNDSDGEIVVD
jgi:hypothetical protein